MASVSWPASSYPTYPGGAPIRQSNLWKDAWRRYRRNRGALVAAWIFILVVLYCLIVPIISRYDPNAVDFSIANENPSLAHLFGTDKFGRDVFSRIMVGSRTTLFVGFVAVGVAALVGVPLGILAGMAPELSVTGVDLSPEMLEVAAGSVPAARLVRADMTEFSLGTRFDVVICVFDTLNHLPTFDTWRAMFERVHEHRGRAGAAAEADELPGLCRQRRAPVAPVLQRGG